MGSLSLERITRYGWREMPPKLTSLFKPEAVQRMSGKQPSRERRIQPRFTTQLRSTFSGTHEEGQGRTLDISIGGCKIESDMLMVAGSTFECRLHVPGLDWPLRIDEVTVRWVDRKTFGIAFTRISSEERNKLKAVIAHLEHEG